MKFLHIIMLVSLLSRAQAQQETAPTPITQLTTGSSSSGALGVEKSRETYLDPEKNRKASWYVSTDTRTLQTSVVFLDSNQRVVYEEVLPWQSVELTSHNRHVLDLALVKVTKRQLVGDRLKTRPIRFESQGQGLPVPEYKAEIPEDTPELHPYGIQAIAMVSGGSLLHLWCKTPEVEKIKVRLRDGIGVVVRFYSVKKRILAWVIHINELSSGNYELKLYGKTWQKLFQVQIDHEHHIARVIPQDR